MHLYECPKCNGVFPPNSLHECKDGEFVEGSTIRDYYRHKEWDKILKEKEK